MNSRNAPTRHSHPWPGRAGVRTGRGRDGGGGRGRDGGGGRARAGAAQRQVRRRDVSAGAGTHRRADVAWPGPLAAPVRWPAGQIGSPRSDEVWTGRRRTHPRTWLARAGAGATAAALCAGTVTACAAPPRRLLLRGIVADRAAPDGSRTLPAGP